MQAIGYRCHPGIAMGWLSSERPARHWIRSAGMVQDININVAAIVEASREQAIGLKEITQAVNTIDQGTQRNAAMVEESNAASHSLASEAEALFCWVVFG
ncbi:hypothetical protein ACLJYM_19995 [Rhizobium giardinii]|uniref:hypothetical protein n=1 Tax=Rhizobium giardinii TaxID=56731 RepID=UPI0039E1FD67